MLGNNSGQLASCDTVKQTDGAVLNYMTKLESTAMETERLLSELFNKLGPIRNQIPTSEKGSGSSTSPMISPIATRIRSLDEKMSVYNYAINQVIKEVET